MNGVDKTRLEFEGRPLLHRVIDTISPLFDEIVIASGTAGRFDDFPHLTQVADDVDGIGPLAGIRAGLAAARSEWAFVVAADMPCVDKNLIKLVLAGCGGDYRAVVPRIGDKLEPLHAAYRTDIVPFIDETIARGDRKVMTALEGLPIKWIYLDEKDSASFFNINYPADVSRRGSSR